jgi:hypothetical protein
VTGAVALAIVLVIAVAGLSVAMQSQQGLRPPGERKPRPPRPQPSPGPRRGRDRTRDRAKPAAPPEPAESTPAPEPAEAEFRGPELLRSGVPTEAKVISVVDERTTGPVTRSRLTLEITPEDGPTFEVMVRIAFPTPESRSRVKVGGTVPVRYDKDERTRVVVDLPQE